MNSHSEKDKKYHADIAGVYDYITNEPRQYPNELLLRPIDKLLKPAKVMLDLGCGTGQMFLRYRHLPQTVIAVDHSKHMLAVAAKKAQAAGLNNVEFIEQDLDEFFALNASLRADLITCVGVLHHLDQNGLKEFLLKAFAMLNHFGQLVIAEPIYSAHVPAIVQSRNSKSILIDRLKECMPADASDPDEEPLEEAKLLEAVTGSGLRVRKISKGFELFHQRDPIGLMEKLIIRTIYWRYRKQGDVIALLLEKD